MTTLKQQQFERQQNRRETEREIVFEKAENGGGMDREKGGEESNNRNAVMSEKVSSRGGFPRSLRFTPLDAEAGNVKRVIANCVVCFFCVRK